MHTLSRPRLLLQDHQHHHPALPAQHSGNPWWIYSQSKHWWVRKEYRAPEPHMHQGVTTFNPAATRSKTLNWHIVQPDGSGDQQQSPLALKTINTPQQLHRTQHPQSITLPPQSLSPPHTLLRHTKYLLSKAPGYVVSPDLVRVLGLNNPGYASAWLNSMLLLHTM